MSMRGIDTQVRKERREVFKEVASLAYYSENLKDDMEALMTRNIWTNIVREPLPVKEFVLPWDFPCALKTSRFT